MSAQQRVSHTLDAGLCPPSPKGKNQPTDDDSSTPHSAGGPTLWALDPDAPSPSHIVHSWQRSYATRLFLTDLAVITASSFAVQMSRLGLNAGELDAAPIGTLDIALDYTVLTLGLIATWLLALSIMGTRDHRLIGSGFAEYRQVATATLGTFGVLAIAAYFLRMPVARGYVVAAFPIGLVLLLIGRWCWRQWLNRQRARGGYTHRAVVVGDANKTQHVIKQMQRGPHAGYEFAGEVTSFGTTLAPEELEGAPTVRGYESILAMIDKVGADTLVLTSADVLTPPRMRQLGWELERRRVALIVVPALTDVAGPRIHTTPVAGLPLIHVEYPAFTGARYFLKRSFDIAASTLLILLLSPLLLAIALLVLCTNPGPVIFKQQRVGIHGERFTMYKFRSMVPDAEAKLSDLQAQSEGNGVLFKIKDDPRITKVGKVLRRFSLDELPQLFNVLIGDMSLVGPRPPLPKEVEMYDEWTHRRLLVKPGITGLWQVSGRSDLSWEDSVRLDLYYVENWSLIGDIGILYRTIRAVIGSPGAY